MIIENHRAAAFWDKVVREEMTEWIADHPAKEFHELFNLVGGDEPFTRDFEQARSVLDVGPGYARLLESAPDKIRFAIEISSENRRRLEGKGITPVDPSDFVSALPGRGIDLAWTRSCLPHCEPGMQRLLFRMVSDLLRIRGVFYVEHVSLRPGRLAPIDPLRAGGYGVRWLELVAMATDVGFRVDRLWTPSASMGDGCALTQILARFVRI